MWVQNKGTTNSEAEGKTEQKVDQRGGGVNQGVPRRRGDGCPSFVATVKDLGVGASRRSLKDFKQIVA